MASCVAQTLPDPPQPRYHYHVSSSGTVPTVRSTLLNVTSSSSATAAAATTTITTTTTSTTTAAAAVSSLHHEEEEDDDDDEEEEGHLTPDTPLNGYDGFYGRQNGHLTAATAAASSPADGLDSCPVPPSPQQPFPAHCAMTSHRHASSADRGIPQTTTTTTTTKTTIWSLPPECLCMIVRLVAAQGVQDLFPLLCVNRAFFHLVVPILYREPFRVAALLVWKQTGYKGMIERQTKLIRTLLHCCTRAVEKVPPPPCQPSSSPSSKTKTATPSSATSACATLASSAPVLPTRVGGLQPLTQPPPQQEQQQQQQQNRWHHFSLRRIHPKRRPLHQYPVQTLAESQSRRPLPPTFLGPATSSNASMAGLSSSIGVASPQPASSHSPAPSSSSSSSLVGLATSSSSANRSSLPTKRFSLPLILSRTRSSTHPKTEATTAITFSPLSTTSSSSIHSISTSPGPLLKPRKRKVEMIPVIWNEELQQPETAVIPGLEHQRSFPPNFAKTVMELRHDPPPMTNYLAYVTHIDVRPWSLALNLPSVGQILGPRYTWRTKLVKFLKDVPSMATGGVFGGGSGNRDASLESNTDSWSSLGGRRRYRGRAKGIWGLHDVDVLELLLLYYTSPNIESLSLGIVCSRNAFTMEEMPSPRIHERLSRLRRIEIDHVEALTLYASAPQRFIRRHQQMFPGQLREVQIRQSCYHSFEKSKSVLDIIHAIDRIEVLDLSVWMGTFAGFETIRTEHLRKLFISHHIDVSEPAMFDQLLEKCPVLEELSIVVTHPDMFLWAVKRKHEEDKKRLQQITTRRQHEDVWRTTGTGWSREGGRRSTGARNNKSALGRRGDIRPRLLPPLKTVVFNGPTLDVVSALKHVFFAFRETLESVHVNMHPDASLQLYMHNLDPSFEHLSSTSSSSVPTVSPFNTVDAIPLQAAAAAASLTSGTGLSSNFPYPIEIYNHQHHQPPSSPTLQQQPLLHSQQSSLDDPMASSSSLLPWTPHGSDPHHWGHSHHHHQQSSIHGYGHGYESLSTSGPSLTPLWALRHRHFLSESRLTPMLGGISMAVEADGRSRRGRGGIPRDRRRKTTGLSGGDEDDDEGEDEGSPQGSRSHKPFKVEDDEEDGEDEDDEEDTFFPTFEQVACPSPYCLSWSWILPKLRTLSIRGPLATQFSMHLTQFCPCLETVHFSSSHGYVVRHQPFF